MSEMNMHRALSPTATQSTPHVFNCLPANITAYDTLLRITHALSNPCESRPRPALLCARSGYSQRLFTLTRMALDLLRQRRGPGRATSSLACGKEHLLWDIIPGSTGEEAFYPTSVDLLTRRPAGIFVSTLSGRALQGPTLCFRRFGSPSLHEPSRLIPCS